MKTSRWQFGLIGWPLEQSFSPQLHKAAMKSTGLEGDYRLFPIPPQPEGLIQLEQIISDLQRGVLHGLNITIPHKRSALPFLDRISDAAKAIGAVNTIFQVDGSLIGENTDAPGFMADLSAFDLLEGGKAIILGAGGGARAAAFALSSSGWGVVLAARRLVQAQTAADELMRELPSGGFRSVLPIVATDLEGLHAMIADCSLVVNATPVGMFPKIEHSPWPSGLPLPPSASVYDMVYNPLQTRFVQDARAAGLGARGGIGMLVEQAALAFEAWTGIRPVRDTMRASISLEK